MDTINSTLSQDTIDAFTAQLDNIMSDASSIISSHLTTEEVPQTTVNASDTEEEPATNTEEEVTVEPFIRPNSGSELISETTTRFSSAAWYKKIQEFRIILAGIGGIGSYVAFLLARMRPNRILIYDGDTVEAVNMAGQLFGHRDLGRTKVAAICDRIFELCEYRVDNLYSRYTERSNTDPIMICGFDNMEARKIFYYNWKHCLLRNRDCGLPIESFLFIDGRIKC